MFFSVAVKCPYILPFPGLVRRPATAKQCEDKGPIPLRNGAYKDWICVGAPT